MTFLLTFLSALGFGGLSSRAKTRIALMCLAEITESAGWGVGEEKYKSLTIVTSSLAVSECWMSSLSSSPDESEFTASSGFLKLSTVSQNWTKRERLRRSMNSMKYDKEVGVVRTSRKLTLFVVG